MSDSKIGKKTIKQIIAFCTNKCTIHKNKKNNEKEIVVFLNVLDRRMQKSQGDNELYFLFFKKKEIKDKDISSSRCMNNCTMSIYINYYFSFFFHNFFGFSFWLQIKATSIQQIVVHWLRLKFTIIQHIYLNQRHRSSISHRFY